jgi:hypothetical protein
VPSPPVKGIVSFVHIMFIFCTAIGSADRFYHYIVYLQAFFFHTIIFAPFCVGSDLIRIFYLDSSVQTAIPKDSLVCSCPRSTLLIILLHLFTSRVTSQHGGLPR